MPGRSVIDQLLFCVRRAIIIPLLIAAPLASIAATAPGESYPSVTLWPLAYHYEETERARTDVLWPIYHQTRTGSHRRFAIRPFIFNYETDPARDFRKTNLFWPLSQFEYEQETVRRWIFPVYYQKQNEFESTLMLWPFYGHSLDSAGNESWSTLYPFFQYQRNLADNSWQADYLWPLGRSYRQGETAGDYFLPLWWRKSGPDSSGGYLFPYFWQSSETKQQKALIPVWYSSRSATTETDYLLLWYAQKRQETRFRTLFPLYWQWQNDHGSRFTLISPIYWSSKIREQQLDVLFPFYFRHDNLKYQTTLRYYFPLYGDYRVRDHLRSRSFLFPLYIKIDDPEHQRKAWYFLWPLVYTEKTPDSFERWAIPFYWHDQRPEKENRMILGLYWDLRQPDSRFTLLAPFYLHTWTPELETRHYIPFYNDIQVAGGYRKSFYLGPLAIVTNDPQNERRQLDILWPLVSKNQQGVNRHFRILPFYWHDEHPDRRLTVGSLALLPPYYINYKTADRTFFHLWPFYGQDQESSYQERSVAWPLVRWGSNPEGTRSAWQAFIAYRDKAPEKSSWGLFPLWHHQQTTGKSRDFSLLHWQEKGEWSSQFSLLHLGQPDLSLFSIRQNKNEMHHHLFPLYSFTADQAQDKTVLWLLGPLYHYERIGPDSSKNQLLWKFLYTEKTLTTKESGFLWRLIRSKTDQQGSLFEFNPFYYGERRPSGESFSSWLGGMYAIRRHAAGAEHKLFWLINWSTGENPAPE